MKRLPRWLLPLLSTGLVGAIFADRFFGGHVIGYSADARAFYQASAVLAVTCCWLALSAQRHARFAERFSSGRLCGLLVAYLGPLYVLDFFSIDILRALALLPLVLASAVVLASLGATGTARLRRLARFEWVASAALLAGSAVFCLVLAEILFTHVISSSLVPENDEQFEALIASKWPHPVPRERRPGVPRILHLGDSFGVVGGDGNFIYRLQNIFARRGVQVEVVNFSRGGYEPLDQLALLRRFAEYYQPDLILHGFFVGNDFGIPDTLRRTFGNIPFRCGAGLKRLLPRYFCLHFWGSNYMTFLRDQAAGDPDAATTRSAQQAATRKPAAASPVGPVPAAGLQPLSSPVAAPSQKPSPQRSRAPRRPQATFSEPEFLRIERNRLRLFVQEPPPPVRWRRAMELLRDIRTEAQRIGSEYLMVLHPTEVQVEQELLQTLVERFDLNAADYDLDLPQAFLLEHCGREGIKCIDLLPVFRADPRTLYLPRDTHYNPKGNRLAAVALSSVLLEMAPFAGAATQKSRSKVGN